MTEFLDANRLITRAQRYKNMRMKYFDVKSSTNGVLWPFLWCHAHDTCLEIKSPIFSVYVFDATREAFHKKQVWEHIIEII